MGKRRAHTVRKPIVHWIGDRDAAHSLAHVNRELLRRLDGVRVLPAGSGHPAVTVRHQWPPDLRRPAHGAWVMMQPWEFGGLPAEWIPPMRDQVDEVWCYTSFVRDRYAEAGIDRTVLVPLGVDTSVFHPGPRADGPFTFLFVGGTIGRKGIDVLLAAWPRAFPHDDGTTRLVIKGSPAAGAYAGSSIHDDLARLRETHPGAAPIEYVDADLAHTEVADLYRASHALVHPYRGEGFGLPVAEAMASGLPVIVTAGGSTDDFCTDATAFRIPASRRLLGDTPNLPPPGPQGYWLLEPDLDATVELLRHVRDDSTDAATRAAAGHAHVAEHLTWDGAAAIVRARITELADPAAATARSRPAPVTPLVSACLIVKDEEELLAGCLASLHAVADEVVVLDTGSTDGTVALARSCGARVLEGEWHDDFGRARNEALAACTGQWILHIDADERVVGGERLRAELALGSTPDVLLVTIDNVHTDGSSGVQHQGARLFRRSRAHWSGRLHEQVVARDGQPSLRRGETGAVRLDHLGYQPELMQARGKAERNVRLAEADLAESPYDDRAALLLNLARSLTVAGRLDEALQRCEEARAARSPRPEVRAAIAHHAAELCFSAGRPGAATPWIDGLAAEQGTEALVTFLRGTAAVLTGADAPELAALAALDADDEVWNGAAGMAVSSDLVQQRRALALTAAGRWPEAADALLGLARLAPGSSMWGPLARAAHEAGTDPTVVADAVPEEHLRTVLVQLLLVAPDAADPVAEALWARWPSSPALVAFASQHGVRTETARCMEWAARVRAAGLTERCPLIGRAQHPEVPALERLRAAAIAHAGFGDPRGAALIDTIPLAEADLPAAVADLEILAPDLLSSTA